MYYMIPDFYIQFMNKLKALPCRYIEKSFPKDKIEEIIVKKINSSEIFSISINERVNYTINKYKGYWIIIYFLSDDKPILFTNFDNS